MDPIVCFHEVLMPKNDIGKRYIKVMPTHHWNNCDT